MDVINRGIKNVFRNSIRSFSIVIILGLSIGLALTMLLSGEAVSQKIDSVKGAIGNIINISPAGIRGFEGGGELLTNSQIDAIASLDHVASINKTLNDRLDSNNTNLESSIEAGSFGRRQMESEGGGLQNANTPMPSLMILGTTDLDNLQSMGGGSISITSGEKFDANSDQNVALLGNDLATKNNLTAGSTHDLSIAGRTDMIFKLQDGKTYKIKFELKTSSVQ